MSLHTKFTKGGNICSEITMDAQTIVVLAVSVAIVAGLSYYY